MENEQQTQMTQPTQTGMNSNQAVLLGTEKPNYGDTEVGKWKPREGYAEYTFLGDRIDIVQYGAQITKVLKILLDASYEPGKIRTLEMTWKDNPGVKTNTGKWVTFVKTQGNILEKGTRIGIFRKMDEKNPNWSIYEFSKVA